MLSYLQTIGRPSPHATNRQPVPRAEPAVSRGRSAAAWAAAAAFSVALATSAAAQTQCRQALVFALDVSSSVDADEYRQQLDGLASALLESDVLDAILGDPEVPMAVAAFEWSNREYSALIVDWTLLLSEADVSAVAERLRRWNRSGNAPTETGIGTGLRVASGLLQRMPDCWEHTVDISTDGKNNDGPAPKTVREGGDLGDATVNAIVVGTAHGSPSEIEEMRTYLERNVLHGPGSFVAVAQGYADYAAAMRRKLLKEIARSIPPSVPPSVNVTSSNERG